MIQHVVDTLEATIEQIAEQGAGIVVVGIPFGSDDYKRAFLSTAIDNLDGLLEMAEKLAQIRNGGIQTATLILRYSFSVWNVSL